MIDAVVAGLGTFVIAAAGFAFAARWVSRPRPVQHGDGRWRMPPRGKGLRR